MQNFSDCSHKNLIFVEKRERYEVKGEEIFDMALDTDNKEMTKRLKYTKKILMKMLVSKTKKGDNNIHKII